jgi:hypothetical protein
MVETIVNRFSPDSIIKFQTQYEDDMIGMYYSKQNFITLLMDTGKIMKVYFRYGNLDSIITKYNILYERKDKKLIQYKSRKARLLMMRIRK